MYARVFHPVDRDRPVATKTWHGVDETTYFEGVADIEALLESELSTWTQAATSFGTSVHPEAQYAHVVQPGLDEVHDAISPHGWRAGQPGSDLAYDHSAGTRRHTVTPDAGIAAVWEGWGGLVSSAGAQRLTVELDDSPSADYNDETGSN